MMRSPSRGSAFALVVICFAWWGAAASDGMRESTRRLSNDVICFELVLEDSVGDGWNGGMYEVSNADVIVATGTLDSGFTGAETLCLKPGCYAMRVTPKGPWPSEITWNLGGVLNGTALVDQDFFVVNATTMVVPGSCTTSSSPTAISSPTGTLTPTGLTPRTLVTTVSCVETTGSCAVTATLDTNFFPGVITSAALTVDLFGDFGSSSEYAEIFINEAFIGVCGDSFTTDCDPLATCARFSNRDVTEAAQTGMLVIKFQGSRDVDLPCGTDVLRAQVTLVVELSETPAPTLIPTTSLAPTPHRRTFSTTMRCFEAGCAANTTFDTAAFAPHIAWAELSIDLGGNLVGAFRFAEITINDGEVDRCGDDVFDDCLPTTCVAFDDRDVTAAARTGVLVISVAGTFQVEGICGIDGHALEANVTLVVELSETTYPTPRPTMPQPPTPTAFRETLVTTATCFESGCAATASFDTAGFAARITSAVLTIDLSGDFDSSDEYAVITINGDDVGLCGEDFVQDCIKATCSTLNGADVTTAARTGMLMISVAGTAQVDLRCGTDGHALKAHVTLVVDLSETTYPTPSPTTSLAPTTVPEGSLRTFFATARCFEVRCAVNMTFDTRGFAERIASAKLTIDIGGHFGLYERRFAEISINDDDASICGRDFQSCAPMATCASFDGRDVTTAARTGMLMITVGAAWFVYPRCGTDMHALEAAGTLVVELSETTYPTPRPTTSLGPTTFLGTSPRTFFTTGSCTGFGDCTVTTAFDTSGFADHIASAKLTIALSGLMSNDNRYAEVAINGANVGLCGDDFVKACIMTTCSSFDKRDVTTAARTGMVEILVAPAGDLLPLCGAVPSHFLKADVTLVVDLSETTYPTPIPTTSLAPTTLIESSPRTLFARTSCSEQGCAANAIFDTAGFASQIASAVLTIELGGDLRDSRNWVEVAINGVDAGLCGEDFVERCTKSICSRLDKRDVTAAARTGMLVISLDSTVGVKPECGTKASAIEADVTLVVELSEMLLPTPIPSTALRGVPRASPTLTTFAGLRTSLLQETDTKAVYGLIHFESRISLTSTSHHIRGDDDAVFDGDSMTQLFNLETTQLTLEGLTLRNCWGFFGGCVQARGSSLVLNHAVVPGSADIILRWTSFFIF